MKKTITLLTILLLVVFMVGCENSVNPTISDTPNSAIAKSDGEPISLAKKDKCTTIQSGDLVASDGSTIEVGFDDWGYNYQARLFNGYYCDSYRDAEWCQDYKDIKLSMKWNDAWLSNKDCDGDGKLDRHYGFDSYIGSGAWLTNHQSGEYEDCKWNYFVKIIAVPEDAFSLWVMSGDFVFNLYSGTNTYVHNFHIETFNNDGTFTATGVNTTDNNKLTSAVGEISGNDFTMTLNQEGGWVGTFTGTIDDGVITGQWQGGNFEFTTGEAKHIWYNADGVEIGPEIWGAFAVIQEVENDACAGLHGLQYNSPDRSGLGGW